MSVGGTVTGMVIETTVVGGAVAAVCSTDSDGGIVPGAALVDATAGAGDVVADPGIDVPCGDTIGVVDATGEAAVDAIGGGVVDAACVVVLEQPAIPRAVARPTTAMATLGDMTVTVAAPQAI